MNASLLWAIVALLSLLTLRGFNNWYQEPASGRRISPGRPPVPSQEGHHQTVNEDDPGRNIS